MRLSSSTLDYGKTWQVFAGATHSLDTRYSRVCWSAGTTPPARPGAADHCGAIKDGGQYIGVKNGRRYSVSMFAYDKATGLYSKPRSRTFTAHNGARSPSALESYATGAGSWYLSWENVPAVTHWTIRIHAGANYNPDDATFVAKVPPTPNSYSTSYELTDLVPDTTYTVFIRPDGPSGPLALPGAETISPHLGGGFLTTFGATTAGQAPVLGSSTAGIAAMTGVSAAMTPSGRIDAVYARGLDPVACHCAPTDDIVYVARTDGQWTEPLTIGTGFEMSDPVIASGGDTVAAAWEATDRSDKRDDEAVFLRVRQDDVWQPVQTLAKGGRPRFKSLVVDAEGHVHLLMSLVTDSGFEMHYLTDASGQWTSTKLPLQIGERLGYDSVADQVVLAAVSYGQGTTSYYLGSTPASATSFTNLSPRYSSTDPYPPMITGLASSGGQITVALERTYPQADSRDGVFFMSGMGVDHVDGLTRVPATGRFARDLSVTAPSPGQVQFAWSTQLNDFAPWQHAGIYTAQRSLGSDGRWQANTPTQRAVGRDDVNPAVFHEPDGTVAVVFEKALVARSDLFED